MTPRILIPAQCAAKQLYREWPSLYCLSVCTTMSTERYHLPPLPLEIVELIISFVTSIETRYNIFDAFPELREFISKTTTVLQYPLKNEVLQWVQVQEFPITSLIINDPTENGDIWLGRSSRCVCPNKKRPRWMTCHECCRIDKLDFVWYFFC